MNKRIEELAKDCFEYYEGTLDGDIVEFNYKKFSELIIKECCQHLTNVGHDRSREIVEQHFGIND